MLSASGSACTCIRSRRRWHRPPACDARRPLPSPSLQRPLGLPLAGCPPDHPALCAGRRDGAADGRGGGQRRGAGSGRCHERSRRHAGAGACAPWGPRGARLVHGALGAAAGWQLGQSSPTCGCPAAALSRPAAACSRPAPRPWRGLTPLSLPPPPPRRPPPRRASRRARTAASLARLPAPLRPSSRCWTTGWRRWACPTGAY